MACKYWDILEINGKTDCEVLLMVPDLQTTAALTLVHIAGKDVPYAIGWKNWNGFRADGSTTLRWVTYSYTEIMATEIFWRRMEQGPIRYKTPKKPNRNSARFNRWINACVYPIYDEPLMRAEEATKFVKMVWDSEQNTGKRLIVLHDTHRRDATYRVSVHAYELVIPEWARRKDALLMLISNILCHGGEHHDAISVRKLVDLYVKYLNRSEAVLLSELYDNGVKVTPK